MGSLADECRSTIGTAKQIVGHHFDIVGWKGAYLNSCQMAGGPACTDANGNVIPKNSLILGTGPAYFPTNPTNTAASWFPASSKWTT